MSKITEISEYECEIIEHWIDSEDCPSSFDPITINCILNSWRRKQGKFTYKQKLALLNVYNGYKLYENKYSTVVKKRKKKEEAADFCVACMNTGRQYYCDDCFGPCLECFRPEICKHPSE